MADQHSLAPASDEHADLAQVKVTSAQVQHHPAGHTIYTVRHGDTLSSIAKQHLGHANRWPRIWDANQKKIHNPNMLLVGMKLRIPHNTAKPDAKMVRRAVAAIPQAPHHHAHHAHHVSHASHEAAAPQAASSGHHYRCGDGDGDGFDMPCSQLHHSQPAGAPRHDAANISGVVNPSAYSGFEACVIRAESGGNSQIMNSTGHYGLYQFAYSTWVAHGGSPSTFGHASIEEQHAVFWNTVHADGTADWAPYDGC